MVLVAAALDALVHGGVHELMEGIRHVAVGLKAALADGGADGRAHRVGVRAVKAHHCDERLEHDAARRAAPAGVDGGDGARGRVVDRDHAAVRAVGKERQVRHVRDERVGVVGPLVPANFAGVLLPRDAHEVGVDLAAADGARGVEADGGAEAAVVFEDVLLTVAAVARKVERVERCGTHAAVTGGEGVAHAADGERAGGVEDHAVDVVLGKGHKGPPFAPAARGNLPRTARRGCGEWKAIAAFSINEKRYGRSDIQGFVSPKNRQQPMLLRTIPEN